MPVQLEKLEKAVSRQDLPAVDELAHRMKGAAANMSAVAFVHLIEELEQASRAGHPEHLARLMPGIKTGLGELKTVMEAYL
jgi:HPt (histidine-containing phosphotransfer) domain-containing protein